jgi:hypothetical protein
MAVISVNEIWEAMMFKRIDRVTILGLIAFLAQGARHSHAEPSVGL